MDATYAAHWANHSGSCKDPLGMDILYDFFEHRFTILQANPILGSKATCTTTANITPYRRKEKSRSTVLHARETPNYSSCPACGEHHSIHHCVTFKSWPVDRQSSNMRKKHLCLNSFGQGHSQAYLQRSPSKCTCRKCSAQAHLNERCHRVICTGSPSSSLH